MLKVGIDSISVYTSHYFLELDELASARNVDPEKFRIGLGQYKMAVPPPGEDVVTMAANAGLRAIRDIDVNSIEMLLFATESGTDQSKAAGIYVHDLLGLPERCRVVELKQACYSGTFGLQLALPFLHQYPEKKVLVIASDIARYGLGTPGESSQGCGAVAMVLSANPRILALEKEYGVVTENVMDFWRPNYSDEAFVDGKYSSRLYLTMLEKAWQQYQAESGRQYHDHDYYCYHVPVPRLAEKGHQHLAKINQEQISEDVLLSQMHDALEYGRNMGNSYTASLYVSLAGLLDLTDKDLTDKRIGFYSYGSGCVAEYFSGVVQPGYKDALDTTHHQKMLADRTALSYPDYVNFYSFHYPVDGSHCEVPLHKTGHFRLANVKDHKRGYEKTLIKVHAPGKLILSGEHAVVYGGPAIAMAVNRYVEATAVPELMPDVLFALSDFSYESRVTMHALDSLKDRVKQKYRRFIKGDFKIRDVLQKPVDLAQVALSIFLEALNIKLTQGVKICVQSDIPIGSGMGSSAATILSIIHAIAKHLRIEMPKEFLLRSALEAENMQHGYSSGLDLQVSLQGGCVLWKDGQAHARSVPNMPMYFVDTGVPESSTGECVVKASDHFKESNLAHDFAKVTEAMDHALQTNDMPEVMRAIRLNHELLVRIGVVPAKVQQFIGEVEKNQGAAKICGAGTVAGDKAGVVWVMTEHPADLTALCAHYNYSILPVMGESRGVHVV